MICRHKISFSSKEMFSPWRKPFEEKRFIDDILLNTHKTQPLFDRYKGRHKLILKKSLKRSIGIQYDWIVSTLRMKELKFVPTKGSYQYWLIEHNSRMWMFSSLYWKKIRKTKIWTRKNKNHIKSFILINNKKLER